MPEHLAAAARRRHAVTRARAEEALRALSSAGDQITFAAVARHAKVSTDFLYNQPDLRTKINDLRTQRNGRGKASEQPGTQELPSASAAVRALSALLKELRRRHAEEVGELRKALAVAQGENLALRRRITNYS